MNIKKYYFFIILLSSLFQQSCDLFSSGHDLEVTLILDSYIYSVGDTLIGKFRVKNNSDEDELLNFPTTCHYGLRIKISNETIYEYPEACATAETTLLIKSGEEKSYKIRIKLWDRNYQNLSVGLYSIEAYLLENYSGIALKNIEIK